MTRQALGLTLFAVLLFGLFVGLGRWQYGKGIEKTEQQAARQRALAAPAGLLTESLLVQGTLPSRVAFDLRRLPDSRWLLWDNQNRDGIAGLRAYAVYRSPAARANLMVDFGWLPIGPERRLPGLPTLPDTLNGEGLLVAWPGQGIVLDQNPWPADAQRPALLAYLEKHEIEADAHAALFDGVLRLDPTGPFGFARDLETTIGGMPPERHFGYAVQWWGLAAATLATTLVLWLKQART